MAKFYGKIGYANTVETTPGVHVEQITTQYYRGDILENARGLYTDGDVNDDINISNRISIVADPYAISNFHFMRYVEFMGTKWKIKNVDVRYPRLILTLGGVYNGEQA